MKKYLIGAFIFLNISQWGTSCKKQDESLPETPDPSYNESFGKRINIKTSFPFQINYWGRNSEELICSSEDFFLFNTNTSQVTSLVTNPRGPITQKGADNHSFVFAGTVSGDNGFFSADINTRVTTKLFSLSAGQGVNFNIANNDIFVYSGTETPSSHPCTTMWDFMCGSGTYLTNTTFYHYNRVTQITSILPHKRFVTFSRDYNKALLSDPGTYLRYFIFDFALQQITDSVTLPYGVPEEGSFYWDATLQYAYVDMMTENIVVLNTQNLQEVRSYPVTLSSRYNKLVWSDDGTKIFFSGPTRNHDGITAIATIDISTGNETRLCSGTFTPQGGGFGNLLPSPDGTKLVFGANSHYYLKAL